MSIKKKVVFITGTRADYGKLKSVINKLKKILIHIYILQECTCYQSMAVLTFRL